MPGVAAACAEITAHRRHTARNTPSTAPTRQINPQQKPGRTLLGASPQVQDAFITGGQNITLGSNEFAALQAIGYVQVPDAATIALLAAGLAAALTLSTRRKRPRA